jgi:hypothetical protein
MPENDVSQPGSSEETIEKKEKKIISKPLLVGSLKRRDFLVLATFWGASACIVGFVLVLFMLRPAQSSQPVYQITPGEITALTLYPLAEEAAQGWESDVQLISASTTWNHASMATLEQPVEWLYRFYSPGLQRILFVIVTPEQEVIVRPHLNRSRRELRIVDPNNWQMDSPTAITVWLNNGGGDWLLQAPNPIVSAQLAFNSTKNSPMWTISGLDMETGQSVRYTLEAKSQ